MGSRGGRGGVGGGLEGVGGGSSARAGTLGWCKAATNTPPGAKADLGVEEVDHRKSKACRPQPVAHGGERYISKGLAVAHVGWVSALSHLAPLWPPGEDEENSSVTSQQLHKVESSSCQLRVHAAERPFKFPRKAPRGCAASSLSAPEPPQEALQQPFSNRRNTISPLTVDGFRGKKSRLALQGQFLLVLKKSGGEPNVTYISAQKFLNRPNYFRQDPFTLYCPCITRI